MSDGCSDKLGDVASHGPGRIDRRRATPNRVNHLGWLGLAAIAIGCASHGASGGASPGKDAAPSDAPVTTDAGPPDVTTDAASPDAGADGALALDSGVLVSAQGKPSDYSCAGAVDAGAPEPAAPHPFHVASLRFKLASGTNLALVDSTGAQQGAAVATDSAGNATLTVAGNSLVSWEVSGQGCPDTCVPTYQFDSLTHSQAEVGAGAVEQALGWDIDDFVGAISRLRGNVTQGLAIGTVEDCAGQAVANAHITATADGQSVPACVSSGTQPVPCLVYVFLTGDFFFPMTATGSIGQFAVLGKPGSVVTAKATGVQAGSTQPIPLGSMTVPLFQESVSLGTIRPR